MSQLDLAISAFRAATVPPATPPQAKPKPVDRGPAFTVWARFYQPQSGLSLPQRLGAHETEGAARAAMDRAARSGDYFVIRGTLSDDGGIPESQIVARKTKLA